MRKVAISILAMVCLSLVVPVESRAEKSTDMEVQLSKSALRLAEVKSPIFGIQKLTGDAQILIAQEGLTIMIEDGRTEKNSGWAVDYRLYAYQKKESGKDIGPVETRIGQGTLSINGNPADLETYHAYPVNLDFTNQTDQPLLHYNGTNEAGNVTYLYKVDQGDISLHLPKGTKAGSYTAQQMISLRDLPKNN